MKKYFVFIISFVILFTTFQILSGLVLTAFYTPNFSPIANNVSQGESYGSISNPILLSLVTATVAYFLSQKIFRNSKNQTN